MTLVEVLLGVATLCILYAIYLFLNMRRMNREPVQHKLAELILLSYRQDVDEQVRNKSFDELMGIIRATCGTRSEAAKRLSHAQSLIRVEFGKEQEELSKRICVAALSVWEASQRDASDRSSK